MKNLIIPVLLLMAGTGAAFATSSAPNEAKAPVSGYRLVEVDEEVTLCVNANKTCTDVDTGVVCTWTDNVTPLREFSTPTMCGEILHEIIVP